MTRPRRTAVIENADEVQLVRLTRRLTLPTSSGASPPPDASLGYREDHLRCR
ncbi:hypothetical protein HPP92_006175 [Vanilla planifolia]|uniref:Uncharacterized protein n=1 Tax=Vanilla planifolia TaxID=51239 RepID=A0A835RVF3_VANPL|nr:hypothetical protein HPP92_006175 [Vanilla planifolia]